MQNASYTIRLQMQKKSTQKLKWDGEEKNRFKVYRNVINQKVWIENELFHNFMTEWRYLLYIVLCPSDITIYYNYTVSMVHPAHCNISSPRQRQ